VAALLTAIFGAIATIDEMVFWVETDERTVVFYG